MCPEVWTDTLIESKEDYANSRAANLLHYWDEIGITNYQHNRTHQAPIRKAHSIQTHTLINTFLL